MYAKNLIASVVLCYFLGEIFHPEYQIIENFILNICVFKAVQLMMQGFKVIKFNLYELCFSV